MKNNIFKIAILLLVMILVSACAKKPFLTIQGQTMGTWYTVKVDGVYTEHEQERIQLAIDVALTKIDQSVNTYNPKSEISKFNTFCEPGGAYPLSEDFMNVARLAEEIYKQSNHAFDPTVKNLVKLWGFGQEGVWKQPSQDTLQTVLEHVGFDKLRLLRNGILKKDPKVQLDFSAIAKGYGVDLVIEQIASIGYENILVEIGGEVRVKGTRHGKPWRIGIAIPDEMNIGNERTSGSIILRDKACATSGDYQQYFIEAGEKYSHLIDPKTGYPIKHDVTSVTVIADNCMLADACATAAIVLGREKGMEFIESMAGVEAYFIYRVGDKLKTLESTGWIKM
jgi:thiamine biosynthesis lipoprotein